jgi:hypothetical protein
MNLTAACTSTAVPSAMALSSTRNWGVMQRIHATRLLAANAEPEIDRRPLFAVEPEIVGRCPTRQGHDGPRALDMP